MNSKTDMGPILRGKNGGDAISTIGGSEDERGLAYRKAKGIVVIKSFFPRSFFQDHSRINKDRNAKTQTHLCDSTEDPFIFN